MIVSIGGIDMLLVGRGDGGNELTCKVSAIRSSSAMIEFNLRKLCMTASRAGLCGDA